MPSMPLSIHRNIHLSLQIVPLVLANENALCTHPLLSLVKWYKRVFMLLRPGFLLSLGAYGTAPDNLVIHRL